MWPVTVGDNEPSRLAECLTKAALVHHVSSPSEPRSTVVASVLGSTYLGKRAAKPDQPFFLNLAYNAPHFPIEPPQEWLDRVRERQPDLDEKRARKVAFLEHFDHGVGRVPWQEP